MHESPVLSINLIGPFRIQNSAGMDLNIRTRKSKALLAAMCVAPDGRRGRAWLQALLWSDRAEKQASSSLRQCIYEIRKALDPFDDVLIGTRDHLELDLKRIKVDVLTMEANDWQKAASARSEFLEGLDVKDPEFDDWLREQRQIWTDRAASFDTNVVRSPATAVRSEMATSNDSQDWSLALAVLPLQNNTGDPVMRFVGEGVSEDLIDRLQRVKWLPVIAKSSAFSSAQEKSEQGPDVIARSLGAVLFVDGALYKIGGQLRVRLRLQETATNRVIWSDQFTLSDLVENQGLSDALNEIVAVIVRTVSTEFQDRAMASNTGGADFAHLIWRGRWHLARLTTEDSRLSREYFDAALELRPESPEALIQLSFWHLWKAWVHRDDNSLMEEGARLARRAVLSEPDDGRCYALMGIADSWRRQHASAIQLLKQAIELTPSLAIAHHQLGSAYCLDDQPEKAIAPLKKAMLYSPRDQLDFTYQTEMAVALLRQNQALDAWVYATNALAQKPRYWYAHLIRVMAAQQIGDGRKVDQAKLALGAAGVHITEQHYDWLPFKTNEWKKEISSVVRTLE